MSAPTALVSAAPVAAPVAAASVTIPSVRISTGVVAPQIVRTVPLDYPTFGLDTVAQNQPDMLVKLVVDEKGHAQDVTVEKRSNPMLDALVVAAIKQYQFKPATLDREPISMHMQLKVVFER